MQTIRTYKIPATDTEGAKIMARSSNGRKIVVPFDYASTDPHRDVANALAKTLAGFGGTCGRPVRWIGEHARGYIFAAD